MKVCAQWIYNSYKIILMKTLICGSLAYDTVLKFPDRFSNYLLAEHIKNLSVCFVSTEMRREFGGAAGNIAYNLKLLGGQPVLMGTVGRDFIEYREWLKKCEIPDIFVKEVEGVYTAQCVITTDIDNNQITSFHPGAMNEAHQNHVIDAKDVTLGIVAPDGRLGMIQHANDFSDLNIPFIFDPGQNVGLFSKKELNTFVEQASWLIMNSYESNLFLDIIGGTVEEHASRLEALIVTGGNEGSLIYHNGSVNSVPAAKISQALDPTGCGDAYRAGILHGLQKGWGWEHIGKLASLTGALNIEHHGTQNHSFQIEDLATRYKTEFGEFCPAI